MNASDAVRSLQRAVTDPYVSQPFDLVFDTALVDDLDRTVVGALRDISRRQRGVWLLAPDRRIEEVRSAFPHATVGSHQNWIALADFIDRRRRPAITVVGLEHERILGIQQRLSDRELARTPEFAGVPSGRAPRLDAVMDLRVLVGAAQTRREHRAVARAAANVHLAPHELPSFMRAVGRWAHATRDRRRTIGPPAHFDLGR